MRFVKGRTYKHKNCLDMAVKVVKAWHGPNYTKLKVNWVDEKGWYYGSSKIKIIPNQYGRWFDITARI